MTTELSNEDKKRIDQDIHRKFGHERFSMLAAIGWLTSMKPDARVKVEDVAKEVGCEVGFARYSLDYMSNCGFLDFCNYSDDSRDYVLTVRGHRILISVSKAMHRESLPRRLERLFYNLSLRMKMVASRGFEKVY